VERTRAILLRKTKLTETSLIVSWLTEEFGRIKTVAKGARKPRSRFAGLLDLFYECEIQFARSSRSELHILQEVAPAGLFPGIRTDYVRLQLASYFIELVELGTEIEHPVPSLYSLLRRALEHLDTHAATRRALLFFEEEFVKDLGMRHSAAQTPVAAIEAACNRIPRTRQPLLASLP
jgi:DNA repair protein RecO (recombination protein O)